MTETDDKAHVRMLFRSQGWCLRAFTKRVTLHLHHCGETKAPPAVPFVPWSHWVFAARGSSPRDLTRPSWLGEGWNCFSSLSRELLSFILIMLVSCPQFHCTWPEGDAMPGPFSPWHM